MFFGLFHLHRIWGELTEHHMSIFGWGFFVALGAFVFCLGMKLLKQRKTQT